MHVCQDTSLPVKAKAGLYALFALELALELKLSRRLCRTKIA